MFAKRTNWNLAANPLSAALERHRAAGKPLLDLTASNPTECGFHFDAQAILSALANPAALHYHPAPRGLPTARSAVAAYYSARNIPVPVDDIILTTSTSEAYAFLLRALANPGDEVLIPAPSYPLFDFLADFGDVKLVRYPLLYDQGWQIDFPSLERALTPQSRAIIVVNPNNPTGHFTRPREAAKLASLCSARQMALIVDEVFLDFALTVTPPTSFAGHSGALTFVLSGLSKICGLPQMKAAWLVASGPEELKTQALSRLEILADTFLSMNAPIQLALPAFLELRHGFQRQLTARVRKNLAELDRQLAAQKPCSRLEIEGGWYVVVRVPRTRSDEGLAIELVNRKGVSVHPGHFYDFPGDGFLIASLIPRERDFAQGVSRLLSLF